MDLQRFLSSEGSDRNKIVGDELKLSLDSTRYQPRVSGSYQLMEVSSTPGASAAANPVRIAEQPLVQREGLLDFTFNQTAKPGSWFFEFSPNAPPDGKDTPATEVEAYAFNVDAQAEGDLRRTSREKLEANPSAPQHLVTVRGFGYRFG